MTTRNKDFYLLLLEYALVDIRAATSEGTLDLVGKLADMFHNVPGALRLPWTEEREERIHEQIKDKAKLYGLDVKLEKWEKQVLARQMSAAEVATSH